MQLYYSLNYLTHIELSYPGGQPLHYGQHICSSGMAYTTLATNILEVSVGICVDQ